MRLTGVRVSWGTSAFHSTPDAKQWYNDVFLPASTSVASGEVDPDLASTFRFVVGKEVGGDGIFVTAVFPDGPAMKAWEKFYDEKKNPILQEGRKAGWLTGDFGYYLTAGKFFRGAKPGPPPPNKGGGIGLYDFELGIPFDAWQGAFTAPEADKLHDKNGIINSVAGLTLGAGGTGIPKTGVSVWHVHKTAKQADLFCKKFIDHTEEPFASIFADGVVKEGGFAKAYEIIGDTVFVDKLPKA